MSPIHQSIYIEKSTAQVPHEQEIRTKIEHNNLDQYQCKIPEPRSFYKEIAIFSK